MNFFCTEILVRCVRLFRVEYISIAIVFIFNSYFSYQEPTIQATYRSYWCDLCRDRKKQQSKFGSARKFGGKKKCVVSNSQCESLFTESEFLYSGALNLFRGKAISLLNSSKHWLKGLFEKLLKTSSHELRAIAIFFSLSPICTAIFWVYRRFFAENVVFQRPL